MGVCSQGWVGKDGCTDQGADFKKRKMCPFDLKVSWLRELNHPSFSDEETEAWSLSNKLIVNYILCQQSSLLLNPWDLPPLLWETGVLHEATCFESEIA